MKVRGDFYKSQAADVLFSGIIVIADQNPIILSY